MLALLALDRVEFALMQTLDAGRTCFPFADCGPPGHLNSAPNHISTPAPLPQRLTPTHRVASSPLPRRPSPNHPMATPAHAVQAAPRTTIVSIDFVSISRLILCLALRPGQLLRPPVRTIAAGLWALRCLCPHLRAGHARQWLCLHHAHQWQYWRWRPASKGGYVRDVA